MELANQNNVLVLTIPRIMESSINQEMAQSQLQSIMLQCGIATAAWTPEIKAMQLAVGIQLTPDEETMEYGAKVIVLEEVLGVMNPFEAQLLIERQRELIQMIDLDQVKQVCEINLSKIVDGSVSPKEVLDKMMDESQNCADLGYAADIAMAKKYSAKQMADALHSQLCALAGLISKMNKSSNVDIGYGVVLTELMSDPVIVERFNRLDAM